MKNLKATFLISLLAFWPARAESRMSGGGFELIKTAIGVTGSRALRSETYNAGVAMGETVAGAESSQDPLLLMSGFYAGGFSNGLGLRLLNQQVGPETGRVFYQDGMRVGVPLQAAVVLTFSDAVDQNTLDSGIHVWMRRNHRGEPTNLSAPLILTYSEESNTLTVLPRDEWFGNSEYELEIAQALQNLDGVPLEDGVHLRFRTWLNPAEDNVIRGHDLDVRIAPHTLRDYSTVLVNPDPLLEPLQIEPSLIEEANRKSRAVGGAYRATLSLYEVAAYDSQGRPIRLLSAPGQMSIPLRTALPPVIRHDTLAWWTLDPEHRAWVKMPASQNRVTQHELEAPLSQFAVYAVMGAAAGSAADSFVFPSPWRPFGPRAGDGLGQTGTLAGGITFNQIPSECAIRVYTVNGDLVRELRHSDMEGRIAQEVWDGKNHHGDPVASGVYLWSVDSSHDVKTGKLVIIR